MRIALLAPAPSEQSGIADYADSFGRALYDSGVQAISPWPDRSLPTREAEVAVRMAAVDWRSFELVHAELGGGRIGEFLALEWLARHHPGLPLTATVHDPERLIWRPVELPRPLAALSSHSNAAHKVSSLLIDRRTLRREQALARRLRRIVTLTHTGEECLQRRLELEPSRVVAIPHGNQVVPPAPLPPEDQLRLLYFGFIHRGKGIEDLLESLALVQRGKRTSRRPIRLTLAGGSEPQITYGAGGGYLESLRQRAQRLGLDQAQLQWRLDIPAREVPALIQDHHLLVLPYRESRRLAWLGRIRGTSGALSWAAACGRGVIASDARAFAEEVSFGNGTVYPQGRIEALAGELEHFAARPDLVRSAAEMASVVGRQRAWPLVASRFRDLFQSVAAA